VRITAAYLKRNRERLDREEAKALLTLASWRRCQARVVTDGGEHYIFCGAYGNAPATEVRPGEWRCKQHEED
jgi:hypothetical protein